MMAKKYTTSDIAKALSVSERTARRKVSKHLFLHNGKYEVSEVFLNFLKEKEGSTDTISDTSDISDEENNIEEIFTPEEYQEFQKRLIEYPLLKDNIKKLQDDIDDHKNNIEYHKRSAESHQRQMELLLIGINERNLIEAKDKKIV